MGDMDPHLEKTKELVQKAEDYYEMAVDEYEKIPREYQNAFVYWYFYKMKGNRFIRDEQKQEFIIDRLSFDVDDKYIIFKDSNAPRIVRMPKEFMKIFAKAVEK